MKLTTRIERLERLARLGEPVRLSVAFFDSILNGTISDEEFALYASANEMRCQTDASPTEPTAEGPGSGAAR